MKSGRTIDQIEAALNRSETVYTFNPQRGWVECTPGPLRRALDWHRKPENARMQWRSDLYALKE